MVKKINKKFYVVTDNGIKFIFKDLQAANEFVAAYNISGKGR